MLQDSIEVKATGHPETCDKAEKEDKDNHDEAACKKNQDLEEVTSAQDIDYADIDADEDLTEKGKKKKKDDRLA